MALSPSLSLRCCCLLGGFDPGRYFVEKKREQQYSVKPLTLRLVVQAWLAPIYLDENRPALQKPLEKAMRAAFNYGRVILTCQGHPDNCQDVTAGVRYSLTGAHKMNQNQHKRATNNTTTLQKSTILLKLQARLKLQDRHYQHYTTD